jgi:transposase InsO family protein
MGMIDPPNNSFENWSLDIVGPFKGKKNYVLLIIDRLCKFTWTKGYRKTPDTKKILKEIDKIKNRTGTYPKRIISDRGLQFRRSEWSEENRKKWIRVSL